MRLLERKSAGCLPVAVSLEISLHGVFSGTVPTFPLATLRVKRNRVSDLGGCIDGITVYLVICTDLSKASNILKSTVRARQVQRAGKRRLGSSCASGVLDAISRVVASRL